MVSKETFDQSQSWKPPTCLRGLCEGNWFYVKTNETCSSTSDIFTSFWLLYFFVGSQSVLTYATSHGLICGWDLRSSKLAWKLENDPAYGNVKFIWNARSWMSMWDNRYYTLKLLQITVFFLWLSLHAATAPTVWEAVKTELPPKRPDSSLSSQLTKVRRMLLNCFGLL